MIAHLPLTGELDSDLTELCNAFKAFQKLTLLDLRGNMANSEYCLTINPTVKLCTSQCHSVCLLQTTVWGFALPLSSRGCSPTTAGCAWSSVSGVRQCGFAYTNIYHYRYVSAVPIFGLQEERDAAERWDEAVAGRSTELELRG